MNCAKDKEPCPRMMTMIEFFTVLVLQYQVNGEDLQSKILYPSLEACSEAMAPVYEPIHEYFTETLARCDRTDIPSKSVRPKARPEGLTNE